MIVDLGEHLPTIDLGEPVDPLAPTIPAPPPPPRVVDRTVARGVLFAPALALVTDTDTTPSPKDPS